MMRRAWHAFWLLVAALGVGCGDSVGPDRRGGVTIAFVDAGGRLNTLREGQAPVATDLDGVLPLAATSGALAFLTPLSDELRIFHLDGTVDTLPVASTGGARAAISPDGAKLAYAWRSRAGRVYFSLVDLRTGSRDSLDLTDRADAPAASQIAGKTPVFSPSGDTVAFLLPNILGVQLFLYEVPTRRVEVFPIRVATTTFAHVLEGWPRWTRDEAIRFLARRHITGDDTDTLMVMRVFPREPDRPADVVLFTTPPDSLTMRDANLYSFSEDGNTVVFSMVASGIPGIFVAQRGQSTMRPLVYQAGTHPRLPLLIP